jgi:hypothetical protein
LFRATLAAFAQDADFALTYYVEQILAAKLGVETCGVSWRRQPHWLASRQIFRASRANWSLFAVERKVGSAVVIQCIAVEGTTVSVVQAID